MNGRLELEDKLLAGGNRQGAWRWLA